MNETFQGRSQTFLLKDAEANPDELEPPSFPSQGTRGWEFPDSHRNRGPDRKCRHHHLKRVLFSATSFPLHPPVVLHALLVLLSLLLGFTFHFTFALRSLSPSRFTCFFFIHSAHFALRSSFSSFFTTSFSHPSVPFRFPSTWYLVCSHFVRHKNLLVLRSLSLPTYCTVHSCRRSQLTRVRVYTILLVFLFLFH